ncbi:hypothetical protein [Ramlibacter sp. WS9]|uniref:hypothetical protein n=1 Tax=Ramlibacter sp. WS9 TaxID=1882741 RepID=UPI001142B2F4|nr:hypothetical protein [Ramlibacter sp. WS9]
MATTHSQQQDSQQQDEEAGGDQVEGQPPPTPDEDGPHDVPDDQVIEKTLPTGPVGNVGS